MIQSTIRMEIPPQKNTEVLTILRSLVELCRYDSGCLSCHIYGDLQETNILMINQVWESEKDLETHIRSGEYRNFLLALEMALKKPEIRFDTILSSSGIETIKRARSRPR